MCQVKLMKRNFSQANISSFKNALMNEKWVYLDDKKDFNDAFYLFYDTFRFNFDTYFPKRGLCIKNYNKKWVDVDVVRSSHLLKDLFVFKDVNTVFREGYKNAKKEHVALLNSKKKQNRIINSDNTIRASWKVVSELVNNNDDNINKKTHSNMHINKNGILVKDP